MAKKEIEERELEDQHGFITPYAIKKLFLFLSSKIDKLEKKQKALEQKVKFLEKKDKK